MPEIEKACLKYQNGQVWGPHHYFEKNKICMEKVVGEQGLSLLSSNIFHTNPLNFPKIQTVV